MTKMKVGVVGLGEIAQIIHLPILQAQADKFEIAAICDISQELLSALGERYNVPAEHRYTDYTDLARQKELDTIAQPIVALGQECITQLLDRIQQPEKPPAQITLPVELIERSSC